MLTKTQVLFAEENALREDYVPDATSHTFMRAYHTDIGVYCVVYDNDMETLYLDDSFFVTYTQLAYLNAREWPVYMVWPQRAVVVDRGKGYVLPRRKQTIERSAPNQDVLDWFLSGEQLRDPDGFPKIGTKWRCDRLKGSFIVKEQRWKNTKTRKPTVVLTNGIGFTFEALERFNKEWRPA